MVNTATRETWKSVLGILLAGTMVLAAAVGCDKGRGNESRLTKKTAMTPHSETPQSHKPKPQSKPIAIPSPVAAGDLLKLAKTHKGALNGRKVTVTGIFKFQGAVGFGKNASWWFKVVPVGYQNFTPYIDCRSKVALPRNRAVRGGKISVSGSYFYKDGTDRGFDIQLKECTFSAGN